MGPKSHFFDNYGTKKKNRFEEEVPSSSQYLENGWLKEKVSFSKLDQRHKIRKENAILGPIYYLGIPIAPESEMATSGIHWEEEEPSNREYLKNG